MELAQRQLSSEAAPFAPKAASSSGSDSTSRPDGDVELDSANVDYSTLTLPSCSGAVSDNRSDYSATHTHTHTHNASEIHTNFTHMFCMYIGWSS